MDRILSGESSVTIRAATGNATAPRPLCGEQSDRVHSRYVRTLADLPWGGVPLRIRVTVRKFFCGNSDCPRRIFAERLDGVARAHARRTDRQRATLEIVGFALGGEAGARLAARLGALASPDTVLRGVRGAVEVARGPVRVLGIDDWSWRRGSRFGTILVDLERHRVVAWLHAHPGRATAAPGSRCRESGCCTPPDDEPRAAATPLRGGALIHRKCGRARKSLGGVMRYEPAIARARLIEAVRAAYGLPGEELAFVPVGYAAACYALHCVGGERYFLKLWPPAPDGRPSPTWREASLRLAHALRERGLYPRVPHPLPTRDGALWATCAGMPFAVFPFLTGSSPPPWSPALWDELARTISAIHRATPALADLLPPRETFAIPFEADLRRGLGRIAGVGAADRPGLRGLRDLVQPRRNEILAQLTRLHGLQRAVRGLSGPFVLCHTDISGDNLLVDEEGRLTVLDWDEATVAPPEHDLHEGREGDIARFLAVYAAAGGAAPLHLDHFAFYLLRRHLGDMAVRPLSIVDGDGLPEQDADALHGIEAWGFAQWRTLDATLGRIAAALPPQPR